MKKKLSIDLVLDNEVEFYEVFDNNGKKCISICGYFYVNADDGPHIVECRDAVEEISKIDFESIDAINEILWSAKQYEDVTSPEEIENVTSTYSGRLLIENVTCETPNGLYMNFEV